MKTRKNKAKFCWKKEKGYSYKRLVIHVFHNAKEAMKCRKILMEKQLEIVTECDLIPLSVL